MFHVLGFKVQIASDKSQPVARLYLIMGKTQRQKKNHPGRRDLDGLTLIVPGFRLSIATSQTMTRLP